MKSPVVRTIVQFLASVLAGGVLGFGGGLLGSALGRGSQDGWGDLIGALFASGLGYIVGAGLGAHFAGRKLGLPTSWWLALLGAAAAGVLVLVLAEPLHINESTTLMQVVLAAAIPLAAVFVPRVFLRK